MCNFFSCIYTKQGRCLWLKDKTSHEDIIDKFKLKDDKLDDRQFVRIELTRTGKLFTKDQKSWQFKIDEQKTLPDRFVPEKAEPEGK